MPRRSTASSSTRSTRCSPTRRISPRSSNRRVEEITMRFCRALFAIVALGSMAPAIAQQPPAARGSTQSAPVMRVYIRAGLKTHGPGQHDYPQFLADWSKILTERGAAVDGSLHFPTPAELASTDVMVMYKGDAGSMAADEEATLDAYLKRGGGLVSFHDTLCGPDPDYYSTI